MWPRRQSSTGYCQIYIDQIQEQIRLETSSRITTEKSRSRLRTGIEARRDRRNGKWGRRREWCRKVGSHGRAHVGPELQLTCVLTFWCKYHLRSHCIGYDWSISCQIAVRRVILETKAGSKRIFTTISHVISTFSPDIYVGQRNLRAGIIWGTIQTDHIAAVLDFCSMPTLDPTVSAVTKRLVGYIDTHTLYVKLVIWMPSPPSEDPHDESMLKG